MKEEFEDSVMIILELIRTSMLEGVLDTKDGVRLEKFLEQVPDYERLVWHGGLFLDEYGKAVRDKDYIRLELKKDKYSERFQVEWNEESKRFLLHGPNGEIIPLNKYTKVVKV